MKTILFFLILIFSGILLSSCSKENEENPAINIPINEVISSTVLNDIKNHMPIYEEYLYPIINGTFYLHPTHMKYSSIIGDEKYYDGNFHFYDCLFTFSKINSDDNSIKVSLEEVHEDGEVDTRSQSNGKSYIYGSGNNFSVCCEMISEDISDGSTYKSLCIISGTKSTNGITNLTFSILLQEKNDPNNDYIDVNAYRLFRDGDGFSTDTVITRSSTKYKSSKLLPTKRIKGILLR